MKVTLPLVLTSATTHSQECSVTEQDFVANLSVPIFMNSSHCSFVDRKSSVQVRPHSHLQPLGDPFERHRRFPPQLHGQPDFHRSSFAPQPQIFLCPSRFLRSFPHRPALFCCSFAVLIFLTPPAFGGINSGLEFSALFSVNLATCCSIWEVQTQ